MLDITWLSAGAVVGLLLSSVFVPPTRKEKAVPMPHDAGVFYTDTGCIRVVSTEVPCRAEMDSFNLLAAK